MNDKQIIYVVVAGGVVQHVENVPEGMEVQVIDHDAEPIAGDRLEVSPLDGEACTIAIYSGD